MIFEPINLPGVPKKLRLFDLKETENDCFIFSKSPYFNLKFGINQSKIG